MSTTVPWSITLPADDVEDIPIMKNKEPKTYMVKCVNCEKSFHVEEIIFGLGDNICCNGKCLTAHKKTIADIGKILSANEELLRTADNFVQFWEYNNRIIPNTNTTIYNYHTKIKNECEKKYRMYRNMLRAHRDPAERKKWETQLDSYRNQRQKNEDLYQEYCNSYEFICRHEECVAVMQKKIYLDSEDNAVCKKCNKVCIKTRRFLGRSNITMYNYICLNCIGRGRS
jgi:hypothetical protein